MPIQVGGGKSGNAGFINRMADAEIIGVDDEEPGIRRIAEQPIGLACRPVRSSFLRYVASDTGPTLRPVVSTSLTSTVRLWARRNRRCLEYSRRRAYP